jgi:hypothetical protein
MLDYAVSNDEPSKQSRAREIVARGFPEGRLASRHLAPGPAPGPRARLPRNPAIGPLPN